MNIHNLSYTGPSQGWMSLVEDVQSIRASFFEWPRPSSLGSGSDEEEAPADLQTVPPSGTPRLSTVPPSSNLYAVAIYMTNFLSNHLRSGRFAICRGFAMRLHGTPRESDDIDFCVKGPSRPELCRAMHLDERFVLPQTKLFVSAFGFYLHTGPALGDNECEEDMIIRIEFLLEGLHPPRLWKEVQEMQYPDRDRKLRVLSRGYMLRSKIRTFAQREAEKDFEDVGYLLSQGIDEGYAIVLE